MKISFADFWCGFDSNNNFLLFLFREIYENVIVTDPSTCDCLIYGAFGKSHRNYNHCKKIFFNTEIHTLPNFDECDYSITSFFGSRDPEYQKNFESKNVRIPLWMLHIDWFNVGSWGNPNWLIPVDYLVQDNPFTLKKKNKFCCTVYSNPRQERVDMVNIINQYKSVDCYGKCHNKQIPQQNNHGGEFEKMNVISDYKFSICFESGTPVDWGITDMFAVTTSEKLLHAKVAGNIPIYYSDEFYSKDFNKECCLNLFDYSNMESMLEDIIKIDNDNSRYESILKEPLFTSKPNLNMFIDKIQTCFDLKI